jgi:thiamine kinase-like enzyme
MDFVSFTNVNWKDFLIKESDMALSFLSSSNFLTRKKIERLNTYLKLQIDETHFVNSNFVWADFDPSNIIIDENNNLSGFVDFEGVIGGDPAYALGCLIAKYGYNELTSSLTEQLDFQKEKLNFYAIIRFLRLIKYSQYTLPTGRDRDNIDDFLPYASKLITILL